MSRMLVLLVAALAPCLATCLRLEVTSAATSGAMAPVRQPMGATFPLRVRLRDPDPATIKAGRSVVVTAALADPESWALTLLNTSVTFTPRSEGGRNSNINIWLLPKVTFAKLCPKISPKPP